MKRGLNWSMQPEKNPRASLINSTAPNINRNVRQAQWSQMPTNHPALIVQGGVNTMRRIHPKEIVNIYLLWRPDDPSLCPQMVWLYTGGVLTMAMCVFRLLQARSDNPDARVPVYARASRWATLSNGIYLGALYKQVVKYLYIILFGVRLQVLVRRV